MLKDLQLYNQTITNLAISVKLHKLVKEDAFALLNYAVKDEEIQRKNAEKYEKMMLFKENFDIQRTDRDRTEDMERQAATKKAAIEFTSAAFTNAMSGLNGATGILQNFFSNNTNRGIGVNSPDNLSEE